MPEKQRERMGDTTLHSLALPRMSSRFNDYLIAVLVVPAVILCRAAIEPLVENDYLFVMTLLGVVYVSWRSGLGPGLITLALSAVGMLLFVKTRSLFANIGTLLAFSMFIICGVCCSALGEAQWTARRRAKSALSVALERKAELEMEVSRRREAEASVRKREADLIELNRQLSESQLQTAEALDQFRSMADSVPVMIWVSEEDSRRRYFNKTWLAFTGRTLEQEMGEGWTANIHPEDRERHRGLYETAIRRREDFELEYRLRRHDGEYRWVIARGCPRFTSANHFAGFCGVCLDVTEQKNATDALAASERQYRAIGERFKTLTEVLPQMTWTATPRGELTFVNHRWMAVTGQSMATRSSVEWLEQVHPDDRESLREEWRRAVAGGVQEFSAEFRLFQACDGKYRWMLARANSLRDESSAVIEWVGSFADIDDQKRQAETLEELIQERTAALREEVEERRRVEHQLTTLATELQRSNGELEKFAYVASHDLQEPLRKIQAFGDRLRTKCLDSLSEVGKDYVERMNSSAARMRKLIDDLLTFSRVTTQARPFVEVDLGRIVNDVVSDLEEYINQNSGAIEVGPLPTLTADPMQMTQLFQNLIANAIKFHRPNVPPVIRIEASESRVALQGADELTPMWRITICDNGIGFDEKYLDRIFQVFQRLHGRDEYEGTGVGLAICRKIVERHGGAITAQSRIGTGTTFIVTLPPHQSSEV